MRSILFPLIVFLFTFKLQTSEGKIQRDIVNSAKEFIPYSVATPLTEGYLQVSEKHYLYYATYGNPMGIPVVILHGGPGIGSHDDYTRFFDLNYWHVVMFDQRGAIRSKPFACMEDNTTQHSVNDIENLRISLNIPKWVVFGHSWGSCLALVYGEEHPESCLGFILEGTFLGREQDIAFFREMGKTSREAYEDFLTHFSPEEEKNIPQACYQKMMDPDSKIHMNMARVIMRYQLLNTINPPTSKVIDHVLSNDAFILSFTRAFVHYAIHHCFLQPNQVLANINKIGYLPAILVHGSMDSVCPLEQALLLHESWKNSELWIIEGAEHSCKEPAITNSLVKATEAFILKIHGF